MADQNKDLLARLTDLSEGAIQRISEAPGAEKAYQATQGPGRTGRRPPAAHARLRGDREAARCAREEGGRAGEAEGGAQDLVSAQQARPDDEGRRRAEEAQRALTLRGRHPQPQRRRHDLEPRGSRPDRLAVDLERQRLGCVYRQGRRPQELDLGVREVLAAVQLRRRREEVELVHVPDQDHVEEAVVLPRVRARASSRLRASGRWRRSRRASRPPAGRRRPARPTRVFCHARNSRVERVEERRLAAEPLRHRVRAPRDGAAHAGRADVGEEAALAACELYPADVDRRASRRRARRAPRRRSRRDAVAAHEVLSRARRAAPRSRAVRPRDAVDDLVDGAVAADDDEQRALALRRAACAR